MSYEVISVAYLENDAGKSQRVAGVAVRERGGVVPVLWADVATVS